MNDRILTNNPDVIFCDAFSKCVNESGYTATDLEEMTGISYKTIMRMMNEKEYNPSLEYVVACSLVLGLVPDDSFELVNLAGYSLRAGIEKEKVFKSLLLNCFEMRSLEYCDDVLKVLKFPTLSSYIKSRKKEK